MKYIIDGINRNYVLHGLSKISTIEEIKSNAGLEALIKQLREAYSNISFQHGFEADAYYQTAIYIFIRMEKPYWKKNTKKKTILNIRKQNNYESFFSEKMSIDISEGFEKAADQLFSQWDRGHMNGYVRPEFPMSALELIAREYSREFDDDDFTFIIEHLKPLALRAEEYFRKKHEKK